VPDSLPVTDEARERLREQAHQLGVASVVRLIDLLHVAIEDMRQGGDPRLPLELALVKVTRASSDLSRESMAFRLDALERGRPIGGAPVAAGPPTPRAAPARTPDPPPTRTPEPENSDAGTRGGGESTAADPAPVENAEPVADVPAAEPTPVPYAGGPDLELDQLQEAWKRSVLPAVEHRSIPTAALLADSRPVELEGDRLTIEFPRTLGGFHRDRAEETKNSAVLQDALHEVTGRRLELRFTLGDGPPTAEHAADHPVTEDEIVALMKSTFDAQELEL